MFKIYEMGESLRLYSHICTFNVLIIVVMNILLHLISPVKNIWREKRQILKMKINSMKHVFCGNIIEIYFLTGNGYTTSRPLEIVHINLYGPI